MSIRNTEIKIKVSLNEQNIPVDMKWMASDSEVPELLDCKAFNLSIWDPAEDNSLGISLWTDTMTIDKMHAHFFRTLMNITGSYVQATGNPYAMEEVKNFCNELAKKTNEWEDSK